jgi:hypothetical protein
MIAELVGFLGTSVGGAVFGQISSFMQSKSEAKLREQQQIHEQNLAFKGELGGYYEKIGKSNPEINHTLGHVISMLAFTYCATILIFALCPGHVIYALDPTDEGQSFSFLWGLLDFQWKPKRIMELTTGGVSLMMAYPVVFILSSVLTGIVPRRFR